MAVKTLASIFLLPSRRRRVGPKQQSHHTKGYLRIRVGFVLAQPARRGTECRHISGEDQVAEVTPAAYPATMSQAPPLCHVEHHPKPLGGSVIRSMAMVSHDSVNTIATPGVSPRLSRCRRTCTKRKQPAASPVDHRERRTTSPFRVNPVVTTDAADRIHLKRFVPVTQMESGYIPDTTDKDLNLTGDLSHGDSPALDSGQPPPRGHVRGAASA